MTKKQILKFLAYGVLVVLVWICGSFTVVCDARENKASLVEKGVESIDEVDETMLYILSLNKKERKAELDKYGVYKLVSPQQRLETALHGAARKRDVTDHLIHIDAVTCVCPDETHRGGDLTVVDGQYVR